MGSSEKYFVTYCVMGMKAGANPSGHATLFFSTQDEKGCIRVEESIGYYSESSSTTNPFIRAAKYLLRINFDLQNTHGILKQEKMKALDGPGLKGISFEIKTREDYQILLKNYKDRIQQEQDEIEFLNKQLKEDGETPTGLRRYIKARANEQSFLTPFHFAPFGASHTCKTRALDYLLEQNVIDDEIKNRIEHIKPLKPFPIASKLKLLPIRLISAGEPVKEISEKSGRIFYNRTWEKNELYWASPIVTVDKLKEKKELAEVKRVHRQLDNMIRRIYKNEIKLRKKVNLTDRHNSEPYLNLLNRILEDITSLRKDLSNAKENGSPEILKDKMKKADAYLNTSTLAMMPNKIHYNFLQQALHSVSMRHALLGLLTVAACTALAYFITPVAILPAAGAAAFTAYKCFGFFKEVVKLEEMKANYHGYVKNRKDTSKEQEPSREPAASSFHVAQSC